MCDTIVIVRDDAVLFAKNSDRDANEAHGLQWLPRTDYPNGAQVKCTWIEIPQATRTWAALISRPFWMWGAEIGSNEHGVTIGNEAIFTRQPYAKTGLTGMDLVRLALERSETAEQACKFVTGLIERHGQGGGCGYERRGFTYHNSFIVADPVRAFVLETAGREWAIGEVRGSRTISNGLTIKGFAEKHSDFFYTKMSACKARRARTQSLANTAKDAGDLFRILRDHGEGREYPKYTWAAGGMAAPCMHAGGALASEQTTASWVAELRLGQSRHWVTATAAPCTGLFKPVYVTEPINTGPFPDAAPDNSLWWRHERFHRLVMQNPAELLPRFAAERDATEAEWTMKTPDSQAAWDEGDRLLEKWTDSVRRHSVQDVRPFWSRQYWAKRNKDLLAPYRK